MHLLFYIFQGIGIAVAIGIRPFTPSLVTGLLAAAGAEIHFSHTPFSFLSQGLFLLAMLICAIIVVLCDREPWRHYRESTGGRWVLIVISLGLAALFFAAVLRHAGHPAWPGIVAGVVCAAIAIAAAQPFLTRLQARLQQSGATAGLSLVAEGSALVVAVLSVLLPPLGLIALLAILWLLYRGRGAGEAKYAGLRILR